MMVELIMAMENSTTSNDKAVITSSRFQKTRKASPERLIPTGSSNTGEINNTRETRIHSRK